MYHARGHLIFLEKWGVLFLMVEEVNEKRRRGRPRKNPMPEEQQNNDSQYTLEEYKELIDLILHALFKNGVDYQTLNELFNAVYLKDLNYPEDFKNTCDVLAKIKDSCEIMAGQTGNSDFEDLKWDVLKHEARHGIFESFIKYMEKNRPANEKFYEGVRDYDRRGKPVLKQVVEAIQELLDDELDELFVNMPSRVGKTQLIKFAFVYGGALHPELANLYSAYSDKITGPFYIGCIELMTDPTYTFFEIFPELRYEKDKSGLARHDGKDEIIDLVRQKTYPTYTCRSIYGTLNGSCDCTMFGITDDLLSGIEEAVNPERLDTVWGKFDNNFIQRLKLKAKLINMGTRWALADPQGRRLDLLQNDEKYKNRRWKAIIIPALDENDESNFDYNYDVGYTTEYYHQRRASFERNDDMASWLAQAMQQPIERDGALFSPGTMKFYNGVLPEGEPDRIFMAIDVAYGGGDYTAGPICYQYGNEFYIPDVVFNDGDKSITRPEICRKILHHKIQAAQFEANKSLEDYKEWIEEKLISAGYKLNITSKPASSQMKKDVRIRDRAPEIREFYFLEDGKRSIEYQKFMQNVYSFKFMKRNLHDDAPDSLAMLCDMIYVGLSRNIEILDRSILGF